MVTFKQVLTNARYAATTKPSWPIFTISKSFPIRYFMTLHHNWYQIYNRSKLKNQLLLSKFLLFKFDLWYFWYHLRYRVIQYLIGKLSDMVKKGQEGLVVAAFLASVRTSWKLRIYYINRALSKLNCYALLVSPRLQVYS